LSGRQFVNVETYQIRFRHEWLVTDIHATRIKTGKPEPTLSGWDDQKILIFRIHLIDSIDK